MKYEYLAILLTILIVSLYLQRRFKIKVFNNLKESIIFYGIILGLGTVWDNFAIYRKHWIFPGNGITGIFIGLVPIEDYLFALILPYALLVIYKAINKK